MTSEPDLFTELYRIARMADRIGGETQRQVVELLERALLDVRDRAELRSYLEADTPEPER